MTRIKVYVLVAENDAEARTDPLWQKLENDKAVLLSCSASLVSATSGAWHYRREISLNEYVCFCCKAQGPVLALLRDLFLQALHRKLAPFPAVVVHTTESLDAISLGRALDLDPFLADRYEYIGTGEKIPSVCVGVIATAFAKAEKLDGN